MTPVDQDTQPTPQPKRRGALVFFLLCCVYGSQIPAIEQLPVDEVEVMNARSLPLMLCATGMVLSVLLWFSERFQPSQRPELDEERARAAHGLVHRVSAVVLILWTLLFTWCLEWLGFGFACAVFLVGGFLLLGERRVWRLLLTSVLVSAVLWGLIGQVLGVYLPPGSLWTGVGVTEALAGV